MELKKNVRGKAFFLFCQKKSNLGEIGFQFFLMVFFFGNFF